MAPIGNGGRGRTGAVESGLGQRFVILSISNVTTMTQDRTGLTTWDTANVYSSGVNEKIVGKAIKKFNIPREEITILAKIMGTVPKEPGIFNWMFEAQLQKSKDYVNQGGIYPFRTKNNVQNI